MITASISPPSRLELISKTFPRPQGQGLKPAFLLALDGVAEATPLQSIIFKTSSKEADCPSDIHSLCLFQNLSSECYMNVKTSHERMGCYTSAISIFY